MMLRALLIVLATAATSLASPPKFDPPEEIKVVSGVALYVPPDDCHSVVYIGLSGEEPFPLAQVGGSKTAFFFLTRGLPDGRYKFVGVATNSNGDQVRKDFSVVVGTPKPPPADPPDDPPPDDPAGKLYFLVVRPDGPAAPSLTKIMSLPEWQSLKGAGHSVGMATAKEAIPLRLGIPSGTTLPVVVTLRVSADGKSSVVVRPAIALPTTGEAIAKLPEGVK